MCEFWYLIRNLEFEQVEKSKNNATPWSRQMNLSLCPALFWEGFKCVSWDTRLSCSRETRLLQLDAERKKVFRRYFYCDTNTESDVYDQTAPLSQCWRRATQIPAELLHIIAFNCLRGVVKKLSCRRAWDFLTTLLEVLWENYISRVQLFLQNSSGISVSLCAFFSLTHPAAVIAEE